MPVFSKPALAVDWISFLFCIQRPTFRNKLIFYDELLAPRPTPKLEDHPLSVSQQTTVVHCVRVEFVSKLT
jgi:hypothetical protein